jgi:C1A family cysteine protease
VATMINAGRMAYIKNFTERNFYFNIEAFRDCLKVNPNHAITIVGQTLNQDWIIRNSWGESWGNNGYFIIKKGIILYLF